MARALISLALACCVALCAMQRAQAQEPKWSDVKKKFAETIASSPKPEDVLAQVTAAAAFDSKDSYILVSDYYKQLLEKIGASNNMASIQPWIDLRLQVVDVLSKHVTSEKAVDQMFKSFKDGWEYQSLGGLVIGKGKRADLLERLYKEMPKVKDGRALIDIFEALANVGDASAVKPIGEAMKNTTAWNAKTAAIDAFRLFQDPAAIPYIAEIFKDKNSSMRLRELARKALIEFTGVDYRDNANMWLEWYEKNQAAMRDGSYAKGDKRPADVDSEEVSTGTYYGIPLKSDRIAFVIDRSGSMAEPYTGKRERKDPSTGAGGEDNKGPDGTTKMEVAKEELIAAIKDLAPQTQFVIVSYSAAFGNVPDFEAWREAMSTASPENKDAAIKWVQGLTPAGQTNIYDALEKAFQIANGGKGNQGGAVVSGVFVGTLVDTIFLMSDGSPNAGKIPEAKDILPAIKKLNEKMKIRIHTIGIGLHNTTFMKSLAEENGGEYVAR